MPRVSVVIPSYNHEKYVAEALDSVLGQTYQDFEIIITDDCSTDGTVKEIGRFPDSRIRLFTFEKNRGASAAVNNSIKESRGEYISILNSDDIFLPRKLEKQVRFLDEHPDVDAIFGYARIVDEDGHDFDDVNHFYHSIFKQPNRTRFEWLKFFFYKHNALCHPTLLIRRQCYEEAGLYDIRLAQLPDFDYWVRVCLKHEIFVMPEDLIKFRVRSQEANASGARPEVFVRSAFEASVILRHFLKIRGADFGKVFPEESKKYGGRIDDETVPYLVAMLALNVDSAVYRQFALTTLFDLIGDENTSKKLNDNYGFDHRELIKITGKYDVFGTQEVRHAQTQREPEQMPNSLSWRLTAPLRKIFGDTK